MLIRLLFRLLETETQSNKHKLVNNKHKCYASFTDEISGMKA